MTLKLAPCRQSDRPTKPSQNGSTASFTHPGATNLGGAERAAEDAAGGFHGGRARRVGYLGDRASLNARENLGRV